MRYISFDASVYDFHNIISDFVGVSDLTQLKMNPSQNEAINGQNSVYKNMEQTEHYQILYTILNSPEGARFYDLYESYIKQVVRPLYDEPILYQKKPTHRIHYKDGTGISRFHKDEDYGHNRAEINYSVPQTPMFGTNSIWIESKENRGDFKPMEMEIGQMAEFKGAFLKHGAKSNKSGQTRVSFDFRVIPISESPDKITDRSSWSDEDLENKLFQNAHSFTICE